MKLRELDFDVTVEQWVVLNKIYETEGQSQRELADSVDKDTPTVTRIVDLLEKKKLVKRVKNTRDRRSYRIKSTTEGKQLVGRIMPAIDEFRAFGLRNISESEVAALINVLNKIYHNFKK